MVGPLSGSNVRVRITRTEAIKELESPRHDRPRGFDADAAAVLAVARHDIRELCSKVTKRIFNCIDLIKRALDELSRFL